MKVIAAALGMLLVILIANQPALAQDAAEPRADALAEEVENVIERSGILDALDAIAVASAPELERSMEQLAGTFESLVSRIANDPALRLSAARAGQGLIQVAEVVLVENTELLRDALRRAAEEIGTHATPQ